MGRVVDMAERFNVYAGPHGVRQDLFGFIDIVALEPGRIIGVQSTGQDFAGHRRKMLGPRRAMVRAWLESYGHVELWGWRKLVEKRGSKRMVWRHRVEVITLETLEASP